MMLPGGAEWIIIGGVVLVLFGASAIPRFARSIGRAKKEFERGQGDAGREEAEARQSAGGSAPRGEEERDGAG